jgi:hypothetical protein
MWSSDEWSVDNIQCQMSISGQSGQCPAKTHMGHDAYMMKMIVHYIQVSPCSVHCAGRGPGPSRGMYD